MCLAIPGIVEKIEEAEQRAWVDYSGLSKLASLMLCPQAKVGDYVLVHAGFVIQVLDAEYGAELHELTEELKNV
ncbi:MAG: HypC/HybG/HupF family hydrogenase formation chaperone [Bacillota bacterium]|nr:HypC/HybG/HupF family hydrogenase formation chaperone [Bacillota bacterium]